MAYETDTATDHIDFVDRVTDFAMNDPGLVGASENWVPMRRMGYRNLHFSSELGNAEAFRAFDGVNANEWKTANGQAFPCYLGHDNETAVDVRRFVITGPNENNQGPRDFDLQWSDDGIIWNTLESWIDQSFTTNPAGNYLTREYLVSAASPGARLHWRLYITDNNGDATNTSIAELHFYEDRGGVWLDVSTPLQIILKGPGLAQQDEIYCGFKIYDLPTSDIYNFKLAAFTGYLDSASFETQPGISSQMAAALWNANMPYWLAVNGQRITAVVKVNTVYEPFYLGKYFPYASPGQHPYPIAIGAPLSSPSVVDYSSASLALPYQGTSARLQIRDAGGAWLQPDCWPWNNGNTYRDIGGEQPVLPIVLNDGGPNLWGELDGVYYCSGFGNASENTIDIGGTSHLVAQGIAATGNDDYFCMRQS